MGKGSLWIILGILLILAIISGIYYLSSKNTNQFPTPPIQTNKVTPSPTPTPTPNPTSNQTKTCQSDADCQPDESCIQTGPIVLDPVTRKNLTPKTCQGKEVIIPH